MTKKSSSAKWIKPILHKTTKNYIKSQRDNPKRVLSLSKWVKLIISVITDVIGMFSYVVPFLGELFDVIWAPVSAFITYKLYENVWFTVLDGIEEILPFTDWIPTVTINWFYNYYIKKQ